MTEEDKRNRELELMMRQEKERDAQKLKLLLLGAGESGKSTLFKQMKILYSSAHGFTDDEKKTYVSTIHQNIYSDMRELLKVAKDSGELDGVKNQDAVAEFDTWDKKIAMKGEQRDVLLSLWEDPVIVNLWENRGEKKIQVQDALEYNMDNIERITKEGFLPTVPDILRSRVRTTGVVEDHFTMDGREFEMYDVGGQRNERRKWIHSFENVTSVIFVAAISEYNQVLFEDQRQNRQDEAITLFGQQLKNEYFLSTPFILFLNKKDLFREKLGKIPFSTQERNSDFEGPHCDTGKTYNTDGTDKEFEACYSAACEYLKALYLNQQRYAPGRNPVSAQVYAHFTNSTDSDNIKNIMNSCKDIILRLELEIAGLLN